MNRYIIPILLSISLIAIIQIASIPHSLILIINSIKLNPHILQILYLDMLLHIQISQFNSLHIGKKRQLTIRIHIVVLVLQHMFQFVEK